MKERIRRRAHAPRCLVLGAALLAAACGDDADSSGAMDTSDAGGPQDLPLAIMSPQGCAVDADCDAKRHCFQGRCAFDCTADADCEGGETCSERGRCLLDSDGDGPGEAALADYEPSVTVESQSDPVLRIREGQAEALLRLDLSGELPGEGLAYTIERDDEEEWDGRVYRAFGDGDAIEIPIPVGLADPALGEESRVVSATVATALGAYRVALVPAAPIGGTYAGVVQLAAFGGTGLPLALEIVTRPDGVSLEDAEEAWLVLPSAVDGLFSPIEAFDGAPDAVAAPLAYDDVVQRWVATTSYEYRLGGGVLAGASGQVGRSLRFELEPVEGGLLIGRLADRWEGLYDARSAQGVLDLVDVVFDGELELERVGSGRGHAGLPAPLSLDAPAPALLPPPPTTLCTQVAFFPATPVTLDGTDYACTGITTRAEFMAAAPAAQAACALASAGVALQGNTTGGAIAAFLDDNVEDPGGQSFADFLEACAAGTGGTCVPSDAILCARQLLARALHDQTTDDDAARQLVVTYQDATREAFLGRQLAAFKTDNDTRLSWLRTSDYPAIVTSAVEDLVGRLLDEWQVGVLDVHIGVLAGYFDPSGLAVLSRQTSGAALDARRRLLAQIVQSWRGTMDALVVASDRWDELYQDADRRAEKAAFVRTRMLDLYLMAGMLGNLSRDAGAGYQATAFGAGFSELMRSVGKLGLSFDELVFARDGEVVISTSLDPMSTNETLLGGLQQGAEAEIMAAGESVQSVLADAEAEALSEAELQNRMANEINELRDELVELCGLPVGCTAQDFRSEPECRVRVAAGECGFSLERGTDDLLAFSLGQQSVSEAGRTLMTMTDAAHAVRISEEELRAHAAQLTLELETLEALAANVEQWNEARLEQLRELDALLKAQGVWDARSLSDLGKALRDKAAVRTGQIDRQRENLVEWDRIAASGRVEATSLKVAVAALNAKSSALIEAGDTSEKLARIAVEGMPKVVGTSSDALGPARAQLLLAGLAKAEAAKATAGRLSGAAKVLQLRIDSQQAARASRLTDLMEEAALDDAISEGQLAEIEDEIERRRAENESAIGDLQSAYDLARAQRDAELAYSRDMAELRRRRTDYLQMLENHAGLDLRVERAQIGVEGRQGDYLAVVQSAELLNARLADLEAQRVDVNQLVGSPGVVFARANRLSQAENRLQRAKEKLMDWLVALEYYAVRPFIDQRLQILLARNPYQLEDIAAEMARLQSACGGAVNQDKAILSVRDDLLGITRPSSDVVEGTTLAPGERFRAVLREGYVPIDKRVRYTTDSTVGDLLEHEGRVLSATFDVSLDDFANLASTCNAKVASLAVQLVGELGDARPTVTILYDGTSALRSCQPGIRDYVELIGRDRTAFDEITMLRVPGRSISPLATLNAWSEDEDAIGNVSLAGLPLASQYTVLIDTEIGENPDLDWSKLEDILLDVRYEYSDVFASGQCE